MTDGAAPGYKQVDADPEAATLVARMDANAQWQATIALRNWERVQLALTPGERLLDVGCGLGEAVLGLAADLGTDGEVVGVDLSTEMLRVARARSNEFPCHVRFVAGDAQALPEANGSFDAVRSERTLQWVPDPVAAVAEMTRVLRPGGRICLTDSDWSTFRVDVEGTDIGDRITAAMEHERGRPSNVGRRLPEMLRAAGFVDVAETIETETWTRWDRDASPAPSGCFSMRSLAEDLVDRGELASDAIDSFVSTVHDAARRGTFRMQLTMHAAYGVMRPAMSGSTISDSAALRLPSS